MYAIKIMFKILVYVLLSVTNMVRLMNIYETALP